MHYEYAVKDRLFGAAWDSSNWELNVMSRDTLIGVHFDDTGRYHWKIPLEYTTRIHEASAQ